MITKTVRAGVCTWVGSGTPNLAHGQSSTLHLALAGTITQKTLIWHKMPFPSGVTITSATLTVYAKGASTGTRTIHADRAAASWKVSTVTYNNCPVTTGTGTTATIGDLNDGDPIEIDVTGVIGVWAGNNANYGLILSTPDSATPAFTLYGFNSDFPPRLEVTWSTPPVTPTTLRPDGGATGRAAWTCAWDFSDADGDDLAAVQVQVDPAANWTAPLFDSGAVTSDAPELDLSTTSFAGLASGSSAYWRCRSQDTSGTWSDWSDPAQVTYAPHGTITPTAPSAATPFIYEHTPTITWTFSGTQKAYRVEIRNSKNAVVADSGNLAGSSQQWAVPAGVITIDGSSWWVRIFVRDDVDRVSSPGDPIMGFATQAFTFQQGSTTTPTSLAAQQVDAQHTAVLLTWDDSVGPDYFFIYRDDAVVAKVLAGDANTGVGTYAYTDYGVSAGVEHAYAIRAVFNGQSSPMSNTATITLIRSGIFLSDPDTGRWFVVGGQAVDDFAMSDAVTIYQPISSSQKVQVTQGQYGLSGTVKGELFQRPGGGRSVAAMEADLFAMKETPEATYRLALGDINIPVKVSNLSSGPSSDYASDNPRRNVSFDFFQCGEFPFTTRI